MSKEILTVENYLEDKDVQNTLKILFEIEENNRINKINERIKSSELHRETGVGNDRFYNKVMPTLLELNIIRKEDEKGNEKEDTTKPVYIRLKKEAYKVAYLASVLKDVKDVIKKSTEDIPYTDFGSIVIFGLPKDQKIIEKAKKINEEIKELYEMRTLYYLKYILTFFKHCWEKYMSKSQKQYVKKQKNRLKLHKHSMDGDYADLNEEQANMLFRKEFGMSWDEGKKIAFKVVKEFKRSRRITRYLNELPYFIAISDFRIAVDLAGDLAMTIEKIKNKLKAKEKITKEEKGTLEIIKNIEKDPLYELLDKYYL